MTMGDAPPEMPKTKKLSEAQRQNSHALIASKLRGYYDSIIDEGTPPHLLELLDRLQKAEGGPDK
jgi:hypothetical protein